MACMRFFESKGGVAGGGGRVPAPCCLRASGHTLYQFV